MQTVENSSEDGNHPDSSSSSESSHSHSSPIRTSDSNPGGRRLELSEVISKEKQKFFMGSAFFKRYNTHKVAEPKKIEPVQEKIGAITPVTPLTQFPRHVPPLNPSNALTSKTLPFAAFCTDSDEPWGFAAVKAPQTEPQSPALPAPMKKKDMPVTLSQSNLVKFAVNSKAAEAHQRLLAGVLPAVKGKDTPPAPVTVNPSPSSPSTFTRLHPVPSPQRSRCFFPVINTHHTTPTFVLATIAFQKSYLAFFVEQLWILILLLVSYGQFGVFLTPFLVKWTIARCIFNDQGYQTQLFLRSHHNFFRERENESTLHIV